MSAQAGRWYELFARGERDWLRHNEKVRDAVRAYVPQLLESPDLMSGHPERPLRVPLHLLEHARFRLADPPGGEHCAGQGTGRPGDMLHPGRDLSGPDGGAAADANAAGAAQPQAGGSSITGSGVIVVGSDDSQGGDDGRSGNAADAGAPGGAGGHAAGCVRVQLEFPASDIMDWLWEELELPLLAPRPGIGGEPAGTRNGWSKQGAPAQLDWRRTVMQAIKRRAAQAGSATSASAATATIAAPAFVNDDLRFRRAPPRPQAAGKAVVLFAMDVSASMTLAERKLAKTFFHFTLHGLRHRYRDVAVRFLAHTTEAWEFPERDFFQISGEGGTQASSVFDLARHIVRGDYGGGRCHVCLFYASDGENCREDRVAASQALAALAPLLNYMGYVETAIGPARPDNTRTSELQRLFAARQQAGDAAAICTLRRPDDAWNAIRRFFSHDGAAA